LWLPIAAALLVVAAVRFTVPLLSTPELGPIVTTRPQLPKPKPPPSPKPSPPKPMSVAADGSTFEIAGISGGVRSALVRSLEAAAGELAAAGIMGWTLRLDIENPQITATDQDGIAEQQCRLKARCRARRSGRSLDLGTMERMSSQSTSATACEEAAGALAKSIVYTFGKSIQESTR